MVAPATWPETAISPYLATSCGFAPAWFFSFSHLGSERRVHTNITLRRAPWYMHG